MCVHARTQLTHARILVVLYVKYRAYVLVQIKLRTLYLFLCFSSLSRSQSQSRANFFYGSDLFFIRQFVCTFRFR